MRLSPLPVVILSLLLASPATAGAEPVRTLAVDPGEALSATLTLPPKGKLTLRAGATRVRIRAERGGDDLLVRRRD
ncbi:MAG TPA: hypothetical protein VD836_07245, partial [Solirubrobacteraceae bacterium]|nr:hypothetical protein [Solirubrobacteraceae bacterium]